MLISIWHLCNIFRHDFETFCTQVEGEQRQLIKFVAFVRSRLSARGSCLFRLARRRAGMSSATFPSLCQSCGFNRNAKCPARLTIKLIVGTCSNSERFFFSTISTTSQEISTDQQVQVFRRDHVENDLSLLTATTGADTLIDEPSPNLCLSASRVSSISCLRPMSTSKFL